MRKSKICAAVCCGALLMACGGNQKEASDAGAEAEAMPELALNEPEPEFADGTGQEAQEEEAEPAPPSQKPTFEPGMSVDEATNAAPFALNAAEVDVAELEKPLMSSGIGSACSIPSSQKYKMKVAVYEGRAVGIDVSTTPASDAKEACIREQIEAITWDVQEESINLVELSF